MAKTEEQPLLPMERYARINTEGFKVGQTILFCPSCEWQLNKPGAGRLCPQCAAELHYVIMSKELLDLQAAAKKQEGRSDLTTDERFRLVAGRSAILPEHVQAKIAETMKGFKPVVRLLVDTTQAGASEKIAELSISMLESLVGLAEHIYTEAANRRKIITLS